MTVYFIGDIQGCYSELSTLLTRVNFSTQHDMLYVAGDLVARGTDSLNTLRLLKSLNTSAKIVLGNHDLHLLAVHHGIKKQKNADNLTELLAAADRDELLCWLQHQPLLQKLPNEKTYMTHAGLPPQWRAEHAIKYATIAHQHLTSDDAVFWLKNMYGERPNSWLKVNNEIDRFRFTINALTRMRFCHLDGSLDFDCKTSIEQAPPHLKPWFEFNQINSDERWVFGHWAALMGHCTKENVYAVDTGCVWGHHLTLLRWHDKKCFIEPCHSN